MADVASNIWKLKLYRFFASLMIIGGFWVPYYTQVGNVTLFQVMLLESIFVIALFLFEIPTGAIADRYGRKLSLILSSFFVCMAVFLYSLYPMFWVFFLGSMIWGLAIALYSGAAEALLYDTLKQLKRESTFKMMFGRFSSYEHVAYLVAGPIGGYLASSYGLRVPMWATVVPVVIAFGICFSLTEPRVHKKVERSYFSTMLDGIKYFRKHKVLQVLAFDRISINLFTWIVFWMYQPLLTERGVSLFYFGIFYSAIFGVPILFYRNLERLERLFGSKKKFLFFSALISSLSLILLGTFDSLVLMSILLIMYFSLNGSRFLLLINYMNKYIPSKIRATVMSTMSMIESFLYAFVFLLTGVLIEWNLLMTFVLFGSFTLIATFFSGVKEEHLLD